MRGDGGLHWKVSWKCVIAEEREVEVEEVEKVVASCGLPPFRTKIRVYTLACSRLSTSPVRSLQYEP